MNKSIIQNISVSALLAALLALGANLISIPIQPVPFVTIQIFLVAGVLLLPRFWGAVPAILYVLLGAVLNLPVFAGAKFGLGIMFGPTGGYIWGYIAAAFIGNLIAHKDIKFDSVIGIIRIITAAVVTILIVYALGVPQLYFVQNAANPEVTFENAMSWGFWPYIWFDILKAGIAVAIVFPIRKVLNSIES